MSESSSSDDEFEGFTQNEVETAIARYNQKLINQGISNENDIFLSDSEEESEENESSDLIANRAGDAAVDTDGWHQNFNYFERGLPHLFCPRGNTGPTSILGIEKDPVDFFQLFLSNEIIQHIIDETDKYAKKQINDKPNENKAPWWAPDVSEMKAFLGLCFLMGITVKPDLKSYWSTEASNETPFYSQTMSRDRFFQIMRYIHFSDCENEPLPGDRNYSCLYKINSIMDKFNEKMKSEYIPKHRVTVDECVIPFKGRVQFKQYMPAKPQKWGIKLWAIAESESGYMSYCKIYSGKSDTTVHGLASNVVKSSLEGAGLVGQGYHVYVDNFFTSPELFLDLYNNYGTGACGTVRRNRRGLPKDIMVKKPNGIYNRGDMLFRQKGPIIAAVWKDKKIVTAISTIHNFSQTHVMRQTRVNGQFTRQPYACPQAIADYTSFMSGVDRADQYIQYYSFQHKTLKWPKRVFFKMIEILKYNAFRLFLLSPNHQPAPGKTQMTFLKFSQSISSGLIAGFSGGCVRRGRPSLVAINSRLTERHLPAALHNKSWCHVCWMRVSKGTQDKRKQTKYGCQECSKHLCLPDCFAVYHSVNNYC